MEIVSTTNLVLLLQKESNMLKFNVTVKLPGKEVINRVVEQVSSMDAVIDMMEEYGANAKIDAKLTQDGSRL